MKGHERMICLYCDYETRDCDAFARHLKQCTDVQKAGVLLCKTCRCSFHNRKLLSDHMRGTHGVHVYVCDMCYFSTESRDDYERHNNEQHLNGPEVVDRKCSKCSAAFSVERQYEHHMMSAHRSDVDFDVDGTFIEERDGAYVCLMCSFETHEKTAITAHIEHHKTRWYRCDVSTCSFVAATKKALNRHKASDHLDLLQQAAYTRAAAPMTSDSSLIYDHETGGLQGHGSGMWQCHICPDKTLYRYRRSYEKHMAKHKGYVEPSIEVQSHRAAPPPPNRGHRKVREELPAARLKQDLAEQDKHNDDCCADLQWNAEEGVRIEAHIDRQLPELDFGANQRSRNEMPQRRVNDADQRNAKHDITSRTPQPIDHQDHDHRTEGDCKVGAFGKPELPQEQKVRRDIHEYDKRNACQEEIIPGDPTGTCPVNADGEKNHGQGESHRERVELFLDERKPEPLQEIDIPQ